MRALVSVVLGLLALAPLSARADELELSVSSSCANVDVTGEVEAALGRSLAPGDAQLRARVAMHREGGRVRVVVGLDRHGVRSERTFTAPDCAHATHAAVLVLALALDHGSAPITNEPSPPIDSDSPAARAPLELDFETQLLVDEPEVIEAPPSSRIDVRTSVLASALVDAGSLPGVEAGARLGLGVSIAPMIIELEATYLSASRSPSAQPGASVDLVLGFGTLRAGARHDLLSWLSIGGAVELDVGAMNGTGAGARLDASSSALLPWLALRGALIVEVAVSSALSLRASGSIGTPLVAPSFDVVGVGSAFSSSIVLGQGAIGLVVHLP